jgi:CSLREA domain-containing protein
MSVFDRSSPLSFRLTIIFILVGIIAAGCTLPRAIEGALGRLDTSTRACDGTPFVVTLSTDAGDGVCNSQCTVREAIQAANDCPGMDEIQLLDGDMNLTQPGPGDDRGDLDITDDVRIMGAPGASDAYTGNSRILGGDHWNQRILHIHPGVNVELEWLEVNGGHEDEEHELGGGIFNEGIFTARNVVVQDSSAWAGGGLYNAGEAEISHGWFGSNEAHSDLEAHTIEMSTFHPAGHILCGGGIANTGELTLLQDSIVVGNSANFGAGICNVTGSLQMSSGRILRNGLANRAWLGGGIFNDGDATLSGLEILENHARAGGGVHSTLFREGHLFIGSSLIEGNTAISSDVSLGSGGGINISRLGTFDLDNLIVRSNQAENYGGGVYLGSRNPEFVPSGSITQSVIYENQAGFVAGRSTYGTAGGFYMDLNSQAEMENVTISRNESDGGAGGMYFRGGSLEMRHATLAENTATRSDSNDLAVGRSGGMTILGTVFYQSSGDPSCTISRPPFSLGWNIEANGHTCINDRDNPTDMVDVDPTRLLESSLTVVGSSWGHRVPIGSDAFERIPPEECLVLEDQVGESRPIGLGCEVGALEEPAVGLAPAPSATPAAITAATTTAPTSREGTTNGNAFCRRGPGTVYDDIDSMVAGTVVPVTGRNQDSSWLVITGPNTGRDCWIAFRLLDLNFPSEQLAQIPVIPAPPTPTPTSEPTATATPVPEPPAAPTNLSIGSRVCSSEEYSLTLTWNDAADNESGYRVYRGGQQIADLGPDTTNYSDSPPFGGPYSYSVEAYNAAGKASAGVQEQGCIY